MKLFVFAIGILLLGCQSQGNSSSQELKVDSKWSLYQNVDTATFAGGCFWCVEASFEQIRGVIEAVSGYAGGSKKTADYRMVSSGLTDHAESVQVYYDPYVIDYETLLEIFFTAHDPTQVDRQGPDVGRQYRSEIFYHNERQRAMAEAKMKELASTYDLPIATKMSKLEAFYPAEDYHQDYERNHPDNSYIINVSRPKIELVARKFKHLLKEPD